MRRAPALRALALGVTLASLGGRLSAQELIDDFERPGAWSAVPGEGVELSIGGGPGREGAALRLDFDFHGRGGYAVAHRELDVPLPENYEISFWIRGPAPSNTLEFKLIDSTGANVWWSVRRDFAPGARWTRIVIPRRHVTFAWGPLGGGELRRAAAIEIAITAGTGGKGTVWLDELTIREREPVRPYTATPRASADGSAAGSSAAFAVDGNPETAWRFAHAGDAPALTVDFGQVRVFGGMTLDWGRGAVPSGATLSVSADGVAWESLAHVRLVGPKDFVRLPEAESRYLRLTFDGPPGRDRALRELTVQPAEWSGSRTPMLSAMAEDAPAGLYPRYVLGRQSYWTVVGSPDDTSEALLGEDGTVEVAPGGPSLEPFVLSQGRLLGWHDAEIEQRLAGQALPVPSVRLRWGTMELDVTAAAPSGGAVGPVAIRYRAINQGTRRSRGTLYLALRPFQVNPPWQFLGVPGGPAAVGRIALRRDWIEVNGLPLVRLVSRPGQAGVAAFANGDIVRRLEEGRLPGATAAEDADSLASAAVAYPFSLGPGDSADVFVVLPLGGGERVEAADSAARDVAGMVERAPADWAAHLAGMRLDGPPPVDTLARAITASLAYILVNRDGAAIQPGSRAYSRSWIRDGSLTSTALLRLGRFLEVRQFIDWFVPYQYPSGRAPCCVDRRGADPVPEHDSTGELIYLIAEYVRMSEDTAVARAYWPVVERGARFLDSLRHERLTTLYASGDSLIFRGLLPPSISHEGYSAKPVHSYWDDFFALRGFKDAAWLARVLGRAADAERWETTAAAFRGDLAASIALVRERKGLAYVPGSADLGDFDATSTTIVFDPVNEAAALPREALEATFARYHSEAMRRADTTGGWEGYTPYEWRNVGALVRLGRKSEALALLGLLLADRRPLAWNQWGEVVWRERRLARFIGDMPHTWVASDFIRSALDLFAFEDADSTLVLLAGVPASWLAGRGIRLERLMTTRGPLTVAAHTRDGADRVTVRLEGTPPAGGILVRPPRTGAAREVLLDGRPVAAEGGGAVRIRTPRAVVEFRYGSAPGSSSARPRVRMTSR